MKTNINDDFEIKCRWNNYTTYRFLLWAWMMNEIAIASAPVDLSHSGFFIHLTLYSCVAIFVGIPLVYSEICIAQYTNCNVVSTWNFCPILRGVGYGTFYFVSLKLVYMMVLSSWFLEYTFYAALDPPPWFSCDGFNDPKCMVKRVNVSLFQRCIEAQNLFNKDCGMKTASNYFFEQEIGNNNTKNKNCVHLWKSILATLVSSSLLFVIMIKKEKVVKILVRMLALYVFFVLFILSCVALSSNGTWYTKIGIYWLDIHYEKYFYIATQGALACGIGSGVIGFLSRDVFFRSPATMTAVSVPLFSIFVTLLLALILFNGIKTVSYYHGEEQDIIEMGENVYFYSFASVSEILSYFDDLPLWSFIWFSTVFVCLFINMMILCLFLLEIVIANIKVSEKYKNMSCLIVLSVTCMLSCPFYCSDLTAVLADVTQIIQLTTSFFFSVGIYWIYGFQEHNVDIIFMIGVKASYFWKIAWVTNPIWILIIIYMRCSNLLVKEYDNSYYISLFSINLNEFLVYLFLGIYVIIIVVGMLIQLRKSHINEGIRLIFSPLSNWGPRDKILFKSRNMFLPEIMTREFLYRQVRIHGYSRRRNIVIKRQYNNDTEEQQLSFDDAKWSAMTSN